MDDPSRRTNELNFLRTLGQTAEADFDAFVRLYRLQTRIPADRLPCWVAITASQRFYTLPSYSTTHIRERHWMFRLGTNYRLVPVFSHRPGRLTYDE